jgi:hypothetical protein
MNYHPDRDDYVPDHDDDELDDPAVLARELRELAARLQAVLPAEPPTPTPPRMTLEVWCGETLLTRNIIVADPNGGFELGLGDMWLRPVVVTHIKVRWA